MLIRFNDSGKLAHLAGAENFVSGINVINRQIGF